MRREGTYDFAQEVQDRKFGGIWRLNLRSDASQREPLGRQEGCDNLLSGLDERASPLCIGKDKGCDHFRGIGFSTLTPKSGTVRLERVRQQNIRAGVGIRLMHRANALGM